MANEQNLLKGHPPTQFKSGQSAVENGRKGGQKKVENLKKAKTMKEILNLMLQCEVSDKEEINKLKENFPGYEEKIDISAQIMAKQVEKAKEGDLKAAEFIRDTTGQKPVEKFMPEREFGEDLDYL